MTEVLQASTTTITIGKALELIDQAQLVLPEIQREFVWSRKSVKLLFDSLYRGLPIGHLLVWKASTAVNTRAFDHKPVKAGMKLQNFYGYLLDGQQRLTALAHVRDGNDDYPLIFYVWPDRKADGDEALYWRGKNELADPWSVPMAEALSDDFNLTERLNAIKATADFRPEHEEIVRLDLEKLRGILKYSLGVTEFETDDYRLATELFVRFNSTGRKLKKSDLNMAELAIRVPGLASNDIRRAQSKWRDFHFTMPFLVQCLLAVHTGRLRLKNPEQFWEGAAPADIKASWKRTERGVAELIEFLSGTVRWTTASLIPSFNALIPLIVVLSSKGKWSVAEKRLARRWLLLASIHALFSGSVQTQLDQLLRHLSTKSTIQQLWNVTKRRLRRLKPEDFETGRISGPAMSLYLSMIREHDARDWMDIDMRLDGSVVGHLAPLHVHHFFPRELLKKHQKYSTADINTFANYTIISASANLNVSTEEPAGYIDRLKIPEGELEKQCVPLDRDLWRAARYEDFVDQRRRLLSQRANQFLEL